MAEQDGYQYKWSDNEVAGYPANIMKYVVGYLTKYPELDASIMMASLNALAYQIDSEPRYKEAMADIDRFVVGQILKHTNKSNVAGTA